MTGILAPKTEAELADILAAQGPFRVEGLGSKRGLGRAEDIAATLSLAAFQGVVAYEPEELILEAGTATPLQLVQRLLREKGQMLAFEPPDYSQLWGTGHSGSLGGLLACGLSGPRRLKAGSARDHVLGVRGVTARGEIFKAGARVVKNVTGYDMPKLLAGSFGTLAAMTSVIFKVLPAPETEETVVVAGLDDASAVRLMSDALQSSAEISAAAHVPAVGTCFRFEGIAISVAARRDRFVSGLQQNCELLGADASRALWSQVRDCKVFAHDATRALWRISLPPMQGAAVAARICDGMDARHFLDWGGGLLWVSLPAQGDGGAARVRAAFAEGHATLFAAPDFLRNAVDVFHPQPQGLAALTARVKASLDPLCKLNPGRMYKGV